MSILNNTKSSIIQGIDALNIIKRLNTLENWRNQFADPNIRKNIENLNTLFNNTKELYSDTETLFNKTTDLRNELNNKIIPKINQTVSQVQDASQKAQTALKNISDIQDNIQNQIIPSINQALVQAQAAATNAQDALSSTQNIYTKLQNAANNFATQSQKMQTPVKNLVNNINYLITDYNEINADLHWWIPNLIGAGLHTIEAVYHTMTSFKALKDVITGLQNDLFISLQKSLS